MCAGRLGTAGAPILLPRQGPLVLGAVSDGDADVLLAEPTVSGRHLRLEVVPCAAAGRSRHEYRRVPSPGQRCTLHARFPAACTAVHCFTVFPGLALVLGLVICLRLEL